MDKNFAIGASSPESSEYREQIKRLICEQRSKGELHNVIVIGIFTEEDENERLDAIATIVKVGSEIAVETLRIVNSHDPSKMVRTKAEEYLRSLLGSKYDNLDL